MLSEFNRLLAPEVLLPITVKSGVRSVKIRETGIDAKLKSLEITGLSEDDLAFTLDHQPPGRLASCFRQLSCYLNVQHDRINKSCDFVVITRRKERPCILFGELKSNKPRESEVRIQLKNSELYVRYLLSLAREWHEERHEERHAVKQEPEFRMVCVHTGKPMAKKRPASRKRIPQMEKEYIRFFPVADRHVKLQLSQFVA